MRVCERVLKGSWIRTLTVILFGLTVHVPVLHPHGTNLVCGQLKDSWGEGFGGGRFNMKGRILSSDYKGRETTLVMDNVCHNALNCGHYYFKS